MTFIHLVCEVDVNVREDCLVLWQLLQLLLTFCHSCNLIFGNNYNNISWRFRLRRNCSFFVILVLFRRQHIFDFELCLSRVVLIALHLFCDMKLIGALSVNEHFVN